MSHVASLSPRSEVVRTPSQENSPDVTLPSICYDLVGTVNHVGSLQSGHYSSNVKVDSRWFHCNDAFVGSTEEKIVINSDGAYILFYIRA